MILSKRKFLKLSSGLLVATPLFGVATRATAQTENPPANPPETPTAEPVVVPVEPTTDPAAQSTTQPGIEILATPDPATQPAAQPAEAAAPTTDAFGNIITPVRQTHGRAIHDSLNLRAQPSIQAEIVDVVRQNQIIRIYGATTGPSPTAYNNLWYQTDGGYIYSAFLQPTNNLLNVPVEGVLPGGFWGEITVPISDAYAAADLNSKILARYYFGCTFKVVSMVTSADNIIWYEVNEINGKQNMFVKAEHVAPIPLEDFTPLSPEVPPEQKRIDVDLKQQLVTAYEFDVPVFSARVATGAKFRDKTGALQDYGTTTGQHQVFLKTPGQRMFGGLAGDADEYDLPGVSWVSYFTASGIAFHGAYWHNDWGTPRSHGCVNMLPDDARWIFRWTMPQALPENTWNRGNGNNRSTVNVF